MPLVWKLLGLGGGRGRCLDCRVGVRVGEVEFESEGGGVWVSRCGLGRGMGKVGEARAEGRGQRPT